MTILVKDGQTIFDIAIIAYQDASRVMDLMTDNPQIASLMDDLTGYTLTYTPSVPVQSEILQTITSTKKNVTISSGQSLFDLALQYYGDASLVYQLISENGLDSILSDATGITLNYTLSKMAIPIYLLNNRIQIATKYITTQIKIPFLLQENGFYILQENGGKIIIT